MTKTNKCIVFYYRALRLLMGFIALAPPFVVSLLSSTPLSSISASYYTEARDAFVGMLFVVSAFLWADKGHSLREAYASKIASLEAVFVAIFPTSCDVCQTEIESIIHYVAAVSLFAMLAYFASDLSERTRRVKEERKDDGAKSISPVDGSWLGAC